MAVGCKKDDPTTPVKDRSFMHVVSVVPNDTFDLTFDYFNSDDVVIDDFIYLRNFPIIGYADLEASGVPDEFGNGKLFLSASKQYYINVKPDTLMPPRDLILAKDEKSTICLGDSMGKLRFLKIKDEFSFGTDTTSAIRFLNLSNGQATASLEATNGALSIPGVAFWSSSQFSNLPHGTYDLELHDAAGALLQTVTVRLNGRTAYSFFAVGNTLDYFVN